MKLKHFLLSYMIFASSIASANIISPFETQFDTDFAYAGVGGLRGTGSGNINLSGVTGSVTKAYLYWHGPTNSSDSTFNANISLNGNSISGTNIGFSDDNFWGQANSQAYRADVTSLVAGNGTYSLTGLSPNNSNGASLVVYYDDGNASNNRDVVTFDGNDANFSNSFDPTGWNTTLSGINYTSGTASLLMGVSDGQNFSSFDDGNFLLNGTILNPGVDLFDGATVPATPGSSVSNGALWDLVEIDITAFLSPGLNTLNITHSARTDALSAIHYQVILPAGSAPDQPDNNIPEPGTYALIGLGLAGIRFSRKNKNKND